jgi:serine phosphatase RsbU (regulator of sigma subunit)
MLKALNRDKEADPKEILSNVREAVDDFVQDAEQFDDLTMLCFTYLGNEGK